MKKPARRRTQPKGEAPKEPHPFAKFEKKKPGRNGAKKEGRSPYGAKFSTRKKASSGRRWDNPSKRETTAEFPLNKYLAHCGVCARRKAVEHIQAGAVKVNKKVVLEPGYKVKKGDLVTFKGEVLEIQQKMEYLLLNKPKDCLTTTKDPRNRRTVMELVGNATGERVYPVGRLDRNTSGLLLLTNDGDLAQQLAHPSGRVKKVYHVTLDHPLTRNDFDHILSGVELEDGVMKVDALAFPDEEDHCQVGLEIHSGRNRIVRRLFEQLGYKVTQLDRVLYAGLTKKNLPRGKWRRLSEKEVRILKHLSGEKKKSAK